MECVRKQFKKKNRMALLQRSVQAVSHGRNKTKLMVAQSGYYFRCSRHSSNLVFKYCVKFAIRNVVQDDEISNDQRPTNHMHNVVGAWAQLCAMMIKNHFVFLFPLSMRNKKRNPSNRLSDAMRLFCLFISFKFIRMAVE